MKEIEQLQKQWNDSARFKGVFANLSLEKDGLKLGAKTVLAKRTDDGALALDGEDAKLLTLLAVAYGRPVDASVLRKLHLVSKHARAGDECMASMHVALAGLPSLSDPSDAARRLFIADGLIAEGVAPRDIWIALEFNTASLDKLAKFNPDEPRNPSGNGNASGEWAVDWGDASIVPAAGLDNATLAVRGKYGRHILAMKRETKLDAGQEHQAAAVVSSGQNDPRGGVSYGAFQLSSKQDSVYEFLHAEGAPWASQFNVHDATDPDGNFAQTWKAIAAGDPDAFFAAQRIFTERTYYDPVVARIAKATGVDIDLMSDAVQNAVLSTAVNNTGAVKRIVTNAVIGLSLEGMTPSSDGYDAALIDRIYAGRAASVAHGYDKFPKESLLRQYEDERNWAQAMREGLY